MRELSLHLMDIAQNSIAAGSQHIWILISENSSLDRLEMEVKDDGKGMDQKTISNVMDPFFTTRNTRKVGLGIPLLKEAAEACNGNLTIDSELGHGTTINVSFQRSHIDRMPLGDLASTLFSLVVSYPQINFCMTYRLDEAQFIFDDQQIKKELAGIPLTEPAVLKYVRKNIEEGLSNIRTT